MRRKILARCMRRLAVLGGLTLAPLFPVWATEAKEPISPLVSLPSADPQRAAIGRRLFSDKRLSANGRTSCMSCHDLARGGADHRAHSLGFRGSQTALNAPTIFNAALNFKQFWNGRASSLEAQIGEVVQSPVEMGSRWKDVVSTLKADGDYRKAFGEAYPDGINRANVENALASFERMQVTPRSRFDRYLNGEAGAITAFEKRGYEKFKQLGCIACHQGRNVGGNMFQKFGVMADYFADRGHVTRADLGRYLVTGLEEDKFVFKVPSLRNVALTAPYFHDGSAATLDDAVHIMLRYQLGRSAPSQDHAAIVAFLKTLTGVPSSR